MLSETPYVFLLTVWPLSLSLATTHEISVDFSSSGYLDVSVPRVPLIYLCIQYTIHDSSSWGFPHSEIPGSMLIYSSPRLIAVSHVLHRLLMPRHSPYALLRLNLYFWFSNQILNCLSFVNKLGFFSLRIEKAFCALFVILNLVFPPFGEIVLYPLLERPI